MVHFKPSCFLILYNPSFNNHHRLCLEGALAYFEVCGCEKDLDHVGLQHHPITVTQTQIK